MAVVEHTENAAEHIRHFHFAFDPAVLDSLRERLAITRWPEAETDDAQGLGLARARALVDYWQHRYDFGRLERRLAEWPQYVTRIDGLDFHFIHARSPHADALPLILTHGWPGSVVEFFDIVRPLTDPTSHGGRPEDAFHVVLPTLPGFGLSEKPSEPGWDLPRIARAWSVLMERLGYARYVAQGGDWGAGVVNHMALQSVPGLAAIHLNLPIVFPPPAAGPEGRLPEEEKALTQLAGFANDAGAYAAIQATRPQTIGYGLTDSPAGMAAWIFEKFTEWSDFAVKPEDSIGLDAILDNIMVYWVTRTAASSARLYRESFFTDFTRQEITTPAAISIFMGDNFTPPRLWCEKTYTGLYYFNQVPRGGHFAAFEQPELFTGEMRRAFASMR